METRKSPLTQDGGGRMEEVDGGRLRGAIPGGFGAAEKVGSDKEWRR